MADALLVRKGGEAGAKCTSGTMTLTSQVETFTISNIGFTPKRILIVASSDCCNYDDESSYGYGSWATVYYDTLLGIQRLIKANRQTYDNPILDNLDSQNVVAIDGDTVTVKRPWWDTNTGSFKIYFYSGTYHWIAWDN